MTTRALVLGGGGPVGIAWETGLAAGLSEMGVELGAADFIMGTSAGSAVGAQLALGRNPRDMAEGIRNQTSGHSQLARRDPVQNAPVADLTPLMGFMQKLYSGDGSAEAIRREIGEFALAAKTVGEEDFVATFGRMVASAEWPSKRYLCTAVDTADGSFVTWDNDSGVPLGRAVASSCSVPGIYPPITINGKRYMDGGMRSGTSADLAAGYGRVIVVSVRAGTEAQRRQNPMAEAGRKRLENEMDAIRQAGGRVELIVPDEEAAATLGINLMDFRQREPALDTGIRQGKALAATLSSFWG